MSKLILCLLLLFNIYICEEQENVRIFKKGGITGNEINVRLGEEFAIEFQYFSRVGNLWNFLNKDETKDILQYLKHYEKSYLIPRHIVGIGRYAYFHFKALKKTNQAVILKFFDGKFRRENERVTTFKINVK